MLLSRKLIIVALAASNLVCNEPNTSICGILKIHFFTKSRIQLTPAFTKMIETISSPRSVAPDPSDLDPPLTFDGLQSVFNKVCPPYREGRKRPSLVSSTVVSSMVTPSSGNLAATRSQGPCKMRQRNSSSLSTRKKSTSLSADRRPIVDHTYTDHLHDPLVCSSEQDSTEKKFTTRGGVTIPFPEKLHAMLSSVEEVDVVTWQPHGRAFLIRDKDRFVNEIMPK